MAGAFEVLSTSRKMLEKYPEITERLDVPSHIAAWLAFFFALDGLCLVMLPRLLPAADWETKVKIREALVSSAHDLLTVPFVFSLLAAVSHTEEGPGGFLGIGPLAHIPMADIDRVGGCFAAFLLWDSAHTLMHSVTYAKAMVENLVHHAAFLSMLLLNRNTLWCNYVFPLLLMAEWSTLLLNARVIYRLLGRTETLVSALFALTFFVTRIVVFGALLLHLFSQFSELSALLPPMLQLSYFGLLPAVYGLNWFWFTKIVGGIMRVLQGQDDGSADGYSAADAEEAKREAKRR